MTAYSEFSTADYAYYYYYGSVTSTLGPCRCDLPVVWLLMILVASVDVTQLMKNVCDVVCITHRRTQRPYARADSGFIIKA